MKFIISLAIAFAVPAAAQAQSTIGDPTPSLGDQARATAATTALNGAMRTGKPTSRAELARRKSHTDQSAACRAKARAAFPAGDRRRYAATERCRSVFQAQKATWYGAAKQAR